MSIWTLQVLEGTKWTGVECSASSFGYDLVDGILAARAADVFVSLPGSGEINSAFLIGGGLTKAKIQLRAQHT